MWGKPGSDISCAGIERQLPSQSESQRGTGHTLLLEFVFMYIIKLESYEHETGKLPEYVKGMKIADYHVQTSFIRRAYWLLVYTVRLKYKEQ